MPFSSAVEYTELYALAKPDHATAAPGSKPGTDTAHSLGGSPVWNKYIPPFPPTTPGNRPAPGWKSTAEAAMNILP